MDVSEQLRQLRQCQAGEFTVDDLMFLLRVVQLHHVCLLSGKTTVSNDGRRVMRLYAKHLGHRAGGH